MPVPQLRNGLRLGLKLDKPKPISLLMSKYVDLRRLPPTPKSFGRFWQVQNYLMLGNSTAGCCFFSAGGHASMLWNAEARRPVTFSDASTIQTYSEATGYDPTKPDTDQGTDMAEGCEFWRTKGILDASGGRHTILAYVDFDPTDRDQRWAATYLFGASLLGIDLPQSAEDEFDDGHYWSYVAGSPSLGGHAVLDVGHKDGMEQLVTWGAVQQSSTYFLERKAVQGAAIVTAEDLDAAGKSPDGFDVASLKADLAVLGGA